MRFLPSLLLLLALAPGAVAQQPAFIAPTDPKTPAEERKTFTVPDGFEVQLVASEPDIQKPIQMAFDAKGRLWVTTSHHYPFAAEKGKAKDKLFILSDFGPDGKAKKVQVFADSLNIPIGILPLPDCKSCIVSSVGEILKLTDTDGDGKADKTEVLFTGFGTRDTHGMYNSFTLMPDGWVYACHGYLNTSKVKGKDGHTVEMNSGNTFRFRPDGSRIEVYTRGQVNPFGIAIDPWFNLYTADCHSKPITQLIPGAYYDSFGKPHDGLGYAPHVTPHDHGSTALCGLTWYDADQFPKQYKGCMFLGNVVTNRINFDRIEWKGATPVAKELPDFLVSSDLWFRPADIKLGPDGALYVTDFYNRIIGHYEVDLKHPQRDKDRGRVWRIVWKGTDGAAPAPKTPFTDLMTESEEAVDRLLGHPNLTVRLLATRELLRRPAERQALKSDAGQEYVAHRMWVEDMPRAGAQLEKNVPRIVKPDTPLVDTHEVRIDLAVREWELEHEPEKQFKGGLTPLFDLTELPPQVARATFEALAAHPNPASVQGMVKFLQKCPADDTHLKFAARIALRNTLRDDSEAWKLARTELASLRRLDVIEAWKLAPSPDSPEAAIIADVALGIPDAQSASYLAKYVATHADAPRLSETVEHIGRYGDDTARDAIVKATIEVKDWRKKHTIILALRKGVAARGQALRLAEQALATGLVTSGLADKDLAIVQAACELAGGMKLTEVRPLIVTVASDTKQPEGVRAAAIIAIAAIDPNAAITTLVVAVNDATNSAGLREKAGQLLGSVGSPEGVAAARAALKTAPYRVSVALAVGMAGSKPGAVALLAEVKDGKAPPRLLQEKAILDRLRAANVPNLDRQIAELTKNLQPADQKLAELLKQRNTKFTTAKADPEQGAKLYTKHCAACHQIGGQGGKVGPNLDGVGARGLERLLEDTLDPNRNVDIAFRARVLNLTDGTTKTGLMLRVEGEVVVMADAEGKEYRVPMNEIASNRETSLSPMPANFGEVIPETDFFHLMAYLLAQRVKDPPPKK